MEHVYFDDTDYPIFYFLLLSYKSLKSGCQIIICFLTLWMILFLVVNLHYHFFLANVLCCLAFGNSLHNTVITGWQPLYNNVVRIYTFQITELNMPQILDHEWTDELLFFFFVWIFVFLCFDILLMYQRHYTRSSQPSSTSKVILFHSSRDSCRYFVIILFCNMFLNSRWSEERRHS